MTRRASVLAGTTVLSLFLACNSAAAACDYPQKTAVPDGRNATEDQMLKGQKAVKAYMAAMDDYLACLDAEAAAAVADGEDPAITAKRQAITDQRHNAAVDEMTRYAESFNEQVRAYKEKNDK
ncbi:MAG: hypothetical protein AAGH76_12515 [Pseudomonadota bacterium]